MRADVIHSLWITTAFAAATVSVVGAVTEAGRVRTARRRLAVLLPEAHQERRPGLRERWRADGAADAIRDWAWAAGALLGWCYLPAFLLIGVAPVMLGLAGALVGGG
ncbi:hypothetical protein ACFV2X_42675 [Streptomyces sp. NPDC059679]|uniref:hypothetical protein n=1 Tax=Streptomyces sp. NPDC059679 TaxID=3346903 RepID=UPI0036CD60FA